MADKKITEYDIEAAFMDMEDELLNDFKKRLEKDIKSGDIKDAYKYWRIEQLKALQQYRYMNDDKFKSKFIKLNKDIEKLLRDTAANHRLNEIKSILNNVSGAEEKKITDEDLILLNDNKLNALVSSVKSDFEKAEYATLRLMDDQYRRVIFNTQIYLNTGTGTLRGAIDKATAAFYEAGINSVQYKNGARVNITSYAEMALRTANKRAALQGAAIARDEYDQHLVIINRRGCACPHCVKYLGRVCIDDVFGNGVPDGKHALLSTFMKGGLYHPNCKDGHTTYYEGITKKIPAVSRQEKIEGERIYKLEQQQRYNERQIRKWKRMEQDQLDPINKEKARLKKVEWQRRNKEFVDSHDELRRKYDREKIY